MTVRELMRELQVYNPDADVVFSDEDTNPFEFSYTQVHFPDDAFVPLVIINIDPREIKEDDDAN